MNATQPSKQYFIVHSATNAAIELYTNGFPQVGATITIARGNFFAGRIEDACMALEAQGYEWAQEQPQPVRVIVEMTPAQAAAKVASEIAAERARWERFAPVKKTKKGCVRMVRKAYLRFE